MKSHYKKKKNSKPVIVYPCYEEELTDEDKKDIQEAREQIKRGEYITLDELKTKLNLT